MKKLTALIAAAAVLSMAGCAPEAEPRTAFVPHGTAVIGLGDSITGDYFLTEAWGTCSADADIRNLLFGACTIDRAADGTLSFNSGAFQSMTVREESNGDRTYVFTLKNGLKYSDGSSIGAKDYVFSVLLQSCSEFAKVDLADNDRYSSLVGWETFSEGLSENFEGVRLLSGNQFSLTIARDALPFYDELSLVEVYPLPLSVIAPECSVTGSGWSGVTATDLRRTILGNEGYRRMPAVTAGPYYMTEITGKGEDLTVTLARNPYYDGGSAGRSTYIAELKISKADLDHPEQYDLITGVAGKDLAVVPDAVKAGMTQLEYEGGQMSAILMGKHVPLNTRRAIAALLDQEECTEVLAGRWGEPIVGMNLPYFPLTETYSAELIRMNTVWNDLTRAETLLAGSEPTLEFIYDRDDPCGAAMAEYLESAAAASGLLTIKPLAVSKADYSGRKWSGRYELLFFRDELPADYYPWDGPEKIFGDLAESMRHLANTSGGLYYRYEEEWLDFQQLYQQELPALGLCAFDQCDLVSERLLDYELPLDPYGNPIPTDWTTMILSAWFEQE